MKRGITPAALAALLAPSFAGAEEVPGRTELHMAVLHRDVDKVRALLNDGAFASAADSDGQRCTMPLCRIRWAWTDRICW